MNKVSGASKKFFRAGVSVCAAAIVHVLHLCYCQVVHPEGVTDDRLIYWLGVSIVALLTTTMLWLGYSNTKGKSIAGSIGLVAYLVASWVVILPIMFFSEGENNPYDIYLVQALVVCSLLTAFCFLCTAYIAMEKEKSSRKKKSQGDFVDTN